MEHSVCLLFAAEGGPRWGRAIGLIVAVLAVLAVRTIILWVLDRRSSAGGGDQAVKADDVDRQGPDR